MPFLLFQAPPAIISTYLGEAVTKYLEEFKSGKVSEYAAQVCLTHGQRRGNPFGNLQTHWLQLHVHPTCSIVSDQEVGLRC